MGHVPGGVMIESELLKGVLSGNLPLGAILLAMLLWIIFRGQRHLEAQETTMKAIPAAILDHKAETKAQLLAVGVDLRAHVTSEAERVIKVVTDHRMSVLVEKVDDLAPPPEPPPRRRATGSQASIRGDQ